MTSGVIRLAFACGLICLLLTASGCGTGASTMDPEDLEGVEWQLVDSGDGTDLATFGITVRFDGEGVGGFSGVNQYGGPYTAGDDGSLEIGELASTSMAGPEPAMEAEQVYLEQLSGCDGYEVAGDRLTLLAGGETALAYEKGQASQ